jgi:hypothetical protein
MFVPVWLLLLAGIVFAVLAGWLALIARGSNPLPFPDKGSRIFSAASPEAKEAIVALLGRHGVQERFQFDSSGIRRSIMWDGTIINVQPAEAYARLGSPAASIGLVAEDPRLAAVAAVEYLRGRGFEADIILDVEPELPIVFVTTNAFVGTVLNFRRHVIHMPRPK